MSNSPLCLLTVHAHPDDEASKGACTVAKYHAEGVRTVLVCCTGGEEGDILNPAMDSPEVRANLPEVRRAELERSTQVIGYDRTVMLGYRDSGMAGTPPNDDPRSFAQAPLGEAVGRLVAIIREERPQVVVTYGEDQQGYPHPDHIRVHEISVAAFDAAGDPGKFGSLGDPWAPSKLYYTVWSGARVRAMHDKFVELGLESPFDDAWLERAKNDPPLDTEIDVTEFADVRRLALLAHATQVDPTSKFWFGLPPEILKTIHPIDEYLLGRGVSGAKAGRKETDLFAGVRSLEDETVDAGRARQAL
jgi:mycothiol S-conjugate amidase